MIKNICLIGLPYSGKSFLGRRLSLYKGMGFIDIDKMIENKYNMKLSNIITNNSITKFIDIEKNVSKIIYCDNCVISPGGSIVYSKESINHFKNNLNADIIHLKLSYNEFVNRVNDLQDRGVIIKPGYTLEDLYNERIYLYEKYSSKTIDVDNIEYIYNNINNII